MNSPQNTSENTNTNPRPGRRKLWLAAVGLAGVIGVSSLGACGHHRQGGWHSGDPAERVAYAVDRVFSKVDATDEQKAKITEIAQSAYKDLAPVRGQMKQARVQAVDILSAEQIDRAALESLRSEQIATADKASARASSALADIAEVLTPTQRQQAREKIAARMEKHGRRGHRWGRHGS